MKFARRTCDVGSSSGSSPVLATSGGAPDRLGTFPLPSDFTFVSLPLPAAVSLCRTVCVGASVLMGAIGVQLCAVWVLLVVGGCEQVFLIVFLVS